MYTGDVYAVDAPAPDSPFDPGIVAYSILPLKDYPLVLTEQNAIELA